jgi:hypothetical protein
MFLDIDTGRKFEYYCTKWSTEMICQCVSQSSYTRSSRRAYLTTVNLVQESLLTLTCEPANT